MPHEALLGIIGGVQSDQELKGAKIWLQLAPLPLTMWVFQAELVGSTLRSDVKDALRFCYSESELEFGGILHSELCLQLYTWLPWGSSV